MFKNKVLLITGGTGSFGNAVLSKFLSSDLKEIRIFSRDEKKQEDMRLHFNNKKIKFYIGDVRDYESVDSAMNGVDYIFHAAALKQVPTCEFYPMEAVKTNINGPDNVLRAAKKNNVKKLIFLSTDLLNLKMFLLSKMKIQHLDLLGLMSKERLNIYLLILFLEKKGWQKNY